MAINNRVLPRPYFFDDPQGSDEDIPAPWANGSNSNIRYKHHKIWYTQVITLKLITGFQECEKSSHLLLFLLFPHSWYGSETAPLLFANNPPDQNHQHHTLYSTPQNWPPPSPSSCFLDDIYFKDKPLSLLDTLTASSPSLCEQICTEKSQEIITKQWICTFYFSKETVFKKFFLI